ncbi:MAG: MerR family transcriptional regulator [Nitrospirae bacterium]|nr:MerR family transcriptional regulator [Nitrospirota bacterium]
MSRLSGLEAYVLRYWESEFPQLKPNKGKSGQRLYSKKDLDAVLHIKQLLYKDGYTIAGARKKMNSKGDQDALESVIASTKKELREILEILK